MSFWETCRIALAAIWANKLRSGLTMLGISIGVFSVVGVMTVIRALESSIETGLSVFGSNIVQIQKYPAFSRGGGAAERFQNRRDIDWPQAQRIMDLLPDLKVCPKVFIHGGIQAVAGNRKTNPNLWVVGTNEHFLAANGYELEAGRNLTAEDVDLGRPVALIGNDLKKRLFPTEDPLGQQLRVGSASVAIVGTLKEKGGGFGGNQDQFVVMPIPQFLQKYGRGDRTINLAVQAPSQAEYAPTVDRAVGAMRVVRGLAAEQPNDFEVTSNDQLIATFNQVSQVVATGAFIISAIALLAAGVGIMNIMLVSVTERTKEIGVRKSLGARRRLILRQFLIEAVVISWLGGAIGIALGAAGGNFVAVVLLEAAAIIPWTWAIFGLLICTGIGIGFGIYPAWKAAALDPIEALRYE